MVEIAILMYAFFLPDADGAMEFHKKVTAKGISAISFKNNLWHFLGNWEHLINRKTAWPGVFPFGEPYYSGKVDYSPSILPVTKGLLQRLIVIPVSLRTTTEAAERLASDLKEIAQETL